MWPVIIALCGLLVSPSAVLGKSLYVSGYREVTLRTGPSLENKILAMLKTGQEVTLVGEEGDYYIVTTPNGTRGYVLKNYMTDRIPAEVRLQEIEQKTQQRIKELEALTQAQEKELTTLREERAILVAAKQKAEETASQQADLASRLQVQQNIAGREEELRWFLAGAGVLLTGFIFGWIWGASRKRNRRNGLTLDRL